VERDPKFKAALMDERERIIDTAENVVQTNIRFSREHQMKKKQWADSSDSRWFLSRLAKNRGYGDEFVGSLNISTPHVIKIGAREISFT
jgi:uncharacterized protein YmfQ (DUF2313 family)